MPEIAPKVPKLFSLIFRYTQDWRAILEANILSRKPMTIVNAPVEKVNIESPTTS